MDRSFREFCVNKLSFLLQINAAARRVDSARASLAHVN